MKDLPIEWVFLFVLELLSHVLVLLRSSPVWAMQIYRYSWQSSTSSPYFWNRVKSITVLELQRITWGISSLGAREELSTRFDIILKETRLDFHTLREKRKTHTTLNLLFMSTDSIHHLLCYTIHVIVKMYCSCHYVNLCYFMFGNENKLNWTELSASIYMQRGLSLIGYF